MLFVALLALCLSVLAVEPDISPSPPDIHHNPYAVSTTTHGDTAFALASHPTGSPSDELEIEKRRDGPVLDVTDEPIEATIVIETVPGALSTVVSSQSSATTITVLSGVTTTATLDPSGVYSTGTGSGSGAGSGPINGPGNSGEPSLPTGAYGQQTPSSTDGQTSSTLGSQSTSSTANSAGQQAPNPTGQQTTSSVTPTPSILVTVVPISGTIVETITIELPPASNSPQSTSSSSSPSESGTWEPLPASSQSVQTTFVTVWASNDASTSCASSTASWSPLPASSSQESTTTITVPAAGSPSAISATIGSTSTVVVTIPNSQEPVSGPTSTGSTTSLSSPSWSISPNSPTPSLIPGWETTPNVPGWATVTGSATSTPEWPTESGSSVTASEWVTVSGTSTITVLKTLQSDSSTAVSQVTSTCTTELYTNVVSSSTTLSTATTAATVAAGGNVLSQQTSWSFETSATASSTVTPVADVNTAVTTAKFNISFICGIVTLALLVSSVLF